MIRFVGVSAVLLIHSELIRQFGGKPGLRDRGLLESAGDHAKNKYLYDREDIYGLAAAYAFGIIQNHPFIDGNKRVGLITAYTFLSINGIELTASEEETVVLITGVASSSVDEATLKDWIKINSVKFA